MPDDLRAPWRTGAPPTIVELTGMFVPGTEDYPTMLTMDGSPHVYLPLFSTAERLKEMMRELAVSYTEVKQITDGREFFETFPRTANGKKVKFIIDPYYTPDRTVRFVEVMED